MWLDAALTIVHRHWAFGLTLLLQPPVLTALMHGIGRKA
jgi:hypothetical protein